MTINLKNIDTEKAGQVAKTATKTIFKMNFSWLGAVGVIFVIAKVWAIGEVANWSWWLVLLPFYFGLAFLFSLLALIAVVFAIGALIYGAILLHEMYGEHKRKKSLAKQKTWDVISKK